ncbi:MAG: aldo/keto reductase [Planctomycetes bacterium]|nr:aldo/keto reductase [Planctomycetota bacterium]
MDNKDVGRRDFLKKSVLAGASLGSIGGLAGAQDSDDKPVEPEKEAKVPRRELGATGEEIPILLFGCSQVFDSKYDKMLHRGFKEGVDYLDTALVYERGQSHKTLAPFVKQVKRENIWITSKGPSSRATVESYTKNLDTCLEQLEVDYLDLYFMHFVKDPKFLDKEYIEMGERMKKSKKTKFFGFSCHDGNVVELMHKAAKVGGIDAIMFRYSFGQYGDKELNKAIDACKEANIGLIAMKTQKSVPAEQEEVIKFKSKDFTLGQAKLKAVWADERIDSAVSHMDSIELLDENVAAAKSPIKLGMDDFHQLNQLAARTSGFSCMGCTQHCEPKVAANTRIADSLRYLMYYECYDEPERAKRLFRELPAAEREIDGVDFERATRACPEGVDIAGRLKLAQDLLA